MPSQFADEASGFEVQLDEIIVTNITGIPLGLNMFYQTKVVFITI